MGPVYLHVTSDDLHVASPECTRQDPHSASHGLHAYNVRSKVAMTGGLTKMTFERRLLGRQRMTYFTNILVPLQRELDISEKLQISYVG